MSPAAKYSLSLLAPYAAGFIGSLFIRPGWSEWYGALAKPPLTPPAGAFLPVWLILYALVGIALGLLWNREENWHPWVSIFFVSLAFNAAWPMFFFGLRIIFFALMDLLCLVLMTGVITLAAMEIERRAGYLLLPYTAWLLFALYLNAGIWLLN